MDGKSLRKVLQRGEGQHVEFKRCGSLPGKDVLETICAFANHFGGSVFLGVLDDGSVEGVGARALEIERNISNIIGNPDVFKPMPVVDFEEIDAEERVVVRVWVPESPDVHSYKGRVYDRRADADVEVRGTARITALGIRKQQIYTEEQVFPYLRREDLRDDVIERVREMAAARRPGHPWGQMSEDEFFRSARLFTRDVSTGEEGFNRAAALLLGKDEAILSICPAYRTDAIFIRDAANRYDDRLTVRTNLVEAYEQLMEFCRKHTDDPFYLEGDVRVSVREIVCRELVANTLVHREYLSPLVSRLMIDGHGILTENPSRAFFDGPVTLENLSPVPKNPIIANLFAQIGRGEELGSGVRNLYRYSRAFMGADPVISEGPTFKALIPDARDDSRTARGADVPGVIERLVDAHGSVTSKEVSEAAGVTQRTALNYLRSMVDNGLLVARGDTRSRRYSRPGT